VEDRQIAKPNALKSKYWAWLDKISCQLADHVLLDTRAQIDYFISEYSLPAEKFTRIYVGADDEIYYPTNKPSATPEQFIVHWHGHIVPFHGLETIIKAAQQLTQYPDIKFQIITRSTKKYQQIKNLTERLGLNNVKFYPETSYQSLARLMNQADVCLGVFGANLKAQVVIPNKIYEALACAKPVITSSQPAMRELFTNGFNIYTVPAVNPQALARAVLKLKGNPGLRQQLGDNAFRLYQEKLKPKIITQPLKQLCQSLLVN
jgi:glycosyltransferase involved in cell wall biosynthesis